MDMPVNNTMLEQAISDYLLWMVSNGYSSKTVESYERVLKHFLTFTNCRNIAWSDIFTLDTMQDFQKGRSKASAHAVRGLSRYLFRQNRISQPIEKKSIDCRKPMKIIWSIMKEAVRLRIGGLNRSKGFLQLCMITLKEMRSIFHH